MQRDSQHEIESEKERDGERGERMKDTENDRWKYIS